MSNSDRFTSFDNNSSTEIIPSFKDGSRELFTGRRSIGKRYRLLPALDPAKEGQPDYATSWLPSRRMGERREDGYAPWNPFFVGVPYYNMFGKTKMSFVSPSTYRKFFDNDDSAYDDPLHIIYNYARKVEKYKYLTQASGNKKEDKAILSRPSTSAFVYAVEVDAGGRPVDVEKKFGVMRLSGYAFESNIIAALNEVRNDRLGHVNLTQDDIGDFFMLGDITHPTLGLICQYEEAKVGTVNCHTLKFTASDKSQAGYASCVVDASVLAKRKKLASDEVFYIPEGQEVVDALVRDGALPTELIKDALASYDFVIPEVGTTYSTPDASRDEPVEKPATAAPTYTSVKTVDDFKKLFVADPSGVVKEMTVGEIKRARLTGAISGNWLAHVEGAWVTLDAAVPPPPAAPTPPPPPAAPVPPPAPVAPVAPPPAPVAPIPPPAPAAPTPPPAPVAPVPSVGYWITENGAVTEVTSDKVKDMVALGSVQKSSPVMKVGETAWKTAGDYFPSLFAAPTPPPAPAAPTPPPPPAAPVPPPTPVAPPAPAAPTPPTAPTAPAMDVASSVAPVAKEDEETENTYASAFPWWTRAPEGEVKNKLRGLLKVVFSTEDAGPYISAFEALAAANSFHAL